MIYLIAVLNVWAVFTLWKNFKAVRSINLDLEGQLDREKKLRFKAECEALAWRNQYKILEGSLRQGRQERRV